MNYIEIRCPNKRAHQIRGITYSVCGHLLGGMVEGQEGALFRCNICNQFFEVSTKDEIVKYKNVTPEHGEKISMLQKRRVVDGN